VDLWTTQARCPQAPQAKQQQKRTFDVLQNADIFTRYGQELTRHVSLEQPITVLREHRRRRQPWCDVLEKCGLEFDLSALPAMEPSGIWESMAAKRRSSTCQSDA
jgi:hypothetical protein